MNALELAWLSVRRRPGSSLAALLAMTLVLLLAASLGRALDSRGALLAELEDSPWHAVVGPKSSSLGLLLDALTFRSPPEHVIPLGIRDSLREDFALAHVLVLHPVARYADALVVGTDAGWLHRPAPLAAPRLVAGRWFSEPEEAVVGRAFAERSGLEIGDTVIVRWSPSERLSAHALARSEAPLSGATTWRPTPGPWDPVPVRALWARELRITGVLDHGGGPEDNLILVDLETSWDHYLLAHRQGLVQQVGDAGVAGLLFVRLRDEADLPRMQRLLHDHSVAQVTRVDEGIAELRQALQAADAGAQALHAGALLLLLLSVLLLLHSRYEALRPELVLLRTLGYGRAHQVLLLAAEAALLLCGALLLCFALEQVGLAWLGPPSWPGLPDADPAAAAPLRSLPLYGLALLSLPAALLLPALRLLLADLRPALQGV